MFHHSHLRNKSVHFVNNMVKIKQYCTPVIKRDIVHLLTSYLEKNSLLHHFAPRHNLSGEKTCFATRKFILILPGVLVKKKLKHSLTLIYPFVTRSREMCHMSKMINFKILTPTSGNS